MSASATPRPSLTPSEIFALAHGFLCDGPDRCHWCGTKCDRRVAHDHRIQPFVRNVHPAKCPGNSYICLGCEFFRRGPTTVRFMDSSLKDHQLLKNWPIYFTDKSVRVVNRPKDHNALLEVLLRPYRRFVLMLTDGPCTNYLQLAVANDLDRIEATTPLYFTLNNVPHSYTVYELDHALRDARDEPQSPGVRALINYIGEVARPKQPIRLTMTREDVLPAPVAASGALKRGRGRPKTMTGDDQSEEQRVRATIVSGGE